MKTLIFLLMLGTTSLAAANTQDATPPRSDPIYAARVSNQEDKVATKYVEMTGATPVRVDGPISIDDLVRREVTWIWVGEDVERLRAQRLR